MRATRTATRAGVLAVVAMTTAAVAGCSSDEAPAPEPPLASPTEESTAAVVAALPHVPAEAERLLFTNLDQVRADLGITELGSDAPADERDAFWSALENETAALTTGLLRPAEDELVDEYGFGAEDVAWEGTFTGPDGDGWVAALAEDVDLDEVQRAIDDGVGPLDGAALDADAGVVSVGGADGGESYADTDLATLVANRPASAVLLVADCLPVETVVGDEAAAELAPTPEEDLAALSDLDGFSVTFGATLATARLGPDRTDLRDRLELAPVLPATDPEFDAVYTGGAVDVPGGRLGYATDDPVAAAALAVSDQLPFAVCAAGG